MTEDIYKAPESELVDSQNRPNTQSSFYVVSQRKFLILFISTVGAYSVYWFYSHWRQYKFETKESIWPVARALFSMFFTHALFKQIDKKAKSTGTTFNWSASGMATLFVSSDIMAYLSSALENDVISILFSAITIWPLYNAQKIANIACSDPQGASNDNITPANILWIIIGFLLWFVTIIGIYEMTVGFPEL